MDDDDDWEDAVWSTIDALESSHLQNRQAQASDAQWACRSCTLLNSAARSTCSVCSTPRGQVYTTAPATPGDAATAGFAGLSQQRKTVQATLPFARAGGTSATSSGTVAPRTSAIDGDLGQRQSATTHPASLASNKPSWPSRATTIPGRTASKRGSQTTGSLAFPVRSGGMLGNSNDDGNGESMTARLRHKGEDSSAKTRYLTDVDAPPTRHSPQIDSDAAGTFVYPTNYSVREYQLTIAEKALYHNTLVSLPTGLGKTLIASVVMYNFYRWFPQGQIVFMAPTKPLVAQQIGACHEIMGIPLSDTAELQGSVPPSTRKILWSTKRVFFCTPQSMQNDLQRGICRAERLVCLVVDEAHRATGNYAYCGVIQEVEKLTKHFRVLALSATPGAKFDVIQDVIRNLRITHIESRSADDVDVKKYTHARQEEVIKCSLNSQIAETKTLFLRVFERITQRLLIGNIIQHKDPERLTRWYVLQMRERFRASPNYQSQRSAESDLALLVSLLHARDLLTAHGLSSFKEWLDGFVAEDQEKGKRISWSKKELLQSTEFQALSLSLQHVSGTDTSNTASHPKLLKLREVLHEHFQRHSAGQSSTRAIVFTQYRSSVQEIVKLLESLYPLIKAQQFIGQGASGKAKESKGQTQKEQQEIVRKFRSGLFNVLVATCIAEEGLDIGEVDLIVSFDALTSPVRMIQRMGRTGRKRVGKVVILVTEGDEEKKLARSVASAKTVSRALTTFKSKFVYGKCARMIPHGISPELSALAMEIPEFHASQVAGKQAAPRSIRADEDTLAERRDAWKLNDFERSIVRGKYQPVDWSDRMRHEILPVSRSRKTLLRRLTNDDMTHPPSARSRALIAIVRTINGVHCDDDLNAPYIVPTPTLNAYPGIGQDDGHVLEFSDPDDGRDYDSHMHFSPPYSAAPEPTTPVRSQGTLEPSTVGSGNQEKGSVQLHGYPNVGGVRHSPLRQVTITGKPSPSPGRRSSNGSSRKVRKKVEKPRDAIDESLLERGERLIERLNAMLNTRCAAAEDPPSPETEPPIPVDDVRAEELRFQLPRIARRLTFEGADEDNSSHINIVNSIENCVPPPPSFNEIFESNIAIVGDAIHVQNPSCSNHGVCAQSDTTSQEKPLVEVKRLMAPENRIASTATSSQHVAVDQEPALSTSTSEVLRDQKSEQEKVIDCTKGIDFDGHVEQQSKKSIRSLALQFPIDEFDDEGDFEPLSFSTHKDKPRPSTEPATTVFRSVSHADSSVRGANRTRTTPSLQRSEGGTNVTTTQEDPCSICCDHESFDDDPIVFCDGCNAAVHQFCYGIPILPSDEWFCDSCKDSNEQGYPTTKTKPRRCALCPMRNYTAVMKQTECGQWVHVQCFMWVPELQFHFESKQLRLGKLSPLDGDRKTLDCSLCHSKRGYGIIQCAHKRCLHAFHVSCAANASSEHYKLVQLDQDEGLVNETLFIAFCTLHNMSTEIWQSRNHPQRSSQQEPVMHSSAAASTSRHAQSTMLSPSALLESQVGSSEKQRKQFRRLKRRYDTARLSDGQIEGTPSQTRSPWAKRVRRSQKRAEGKRAQAKVIARMFIDDEVEAPSSGGDDDDDDDELNAEDRDFINDSSQLIFSPSVQTSLRKKKNKRNSLGDMRAIYARSLLESPPTPAFLKRGRRNLPSNGVISACLQELSEERRVSQPPPSSSSSQMSQTFNREAADRVDDVIEIMDESQAELRSNQDNKTDSDDMPLEVSTPSFNLLEISTPTAPSGTSKTVSEDGTKESCSVSSEADAAESLHEKIEANRLRALRLLEAKKEAAKRIQPSVPANCLVNEATRRDTDDDRKSGVGHLSNIAPSRSCVSATTPDRNGQPPSFSLLETAIATNHVASPRQASAKTGHEDSDIVMYMQPAFRVSPVFDILEISTTSQPERLSFEEVESLDVNALLSFRVAVVVISMKTSKTVNLLQLPMVQLACQVYKSFVIVIHVTERALVEEISISEGVRRVHELSSCRQVIVACEGPVICDALLSIARLEASLGFGLLSTIAPQRQEPVRGVDINFHERFRFFMSTNLLSIGSAISLSFRFDKFSVKQIPVAKFGVMHWRRMLPWISETTAKLLHARFVPRAG